MKFENHEEMYNSLPWDPFDGLRNAFRINFHPRHHDQEYIFLHRLFNFRYNMAYHVNIIAENSNKYEIIKYKIINY